MIRDPRGNILYINQNTENVGCTNSENFKQVKQYNKDWNRDCIWVIAGLIRAQISTTSLSKFGKDSISL